MTAHGPGRRWLLEEPAGPGTVTITVTVTATTMISPSNSTEIREGIMFLSDGIKLTSRSNLT